MNENDNVQARSFSLRMITTEQWAAAGIVLLLLIMIYLQTLIWMLHRWMAVDSYYSHGFLVPIVMLYLLWERRQSLYEATQDLTETAGKGLGLGLILAALLMHVLSGYFRVFFTSGFSFVLMLYGVSIYLYGKKIFRHIWFAFGFLAFMIPLPLLVIAGLSLRLKLLATAWALRVLDLVGILAVQDGSRIIFVNDAITVGDACSGLRSIIALLALGSVYAYVFKGTLKPGENRVGHRIKQVILFLCSIPVAMVANVLRIFIVGLVANSYGSALATGTVHDISGYMLFLVAFLLLFLIGKGLDLLIRT